MRLALLPLLALPAALRGLAAAQESATYTPAALGGDPMAILNMLPDCAIPCLTKALAISSCDPTDVACRCSDQTLVSAASGCIAQECTIVEALHAKNLTDTDCNAPVRDLSKRYSNISTSIMVISCFVVVCRILFKVFVTPAGFGWDDLAILLTLISAIPSAWDNVQVMAENGLGKDIWTLNQDQITQFAKGFFILTLLYFWQVFTLKLSILCFYLRIFPNVRKLLLATVAFDILFGVAFILAAAFQCIPVDLNWTKWKAPPNDIGGVCVDNGAIAWANAIISIILDIWMLLLPLSQLKELNLRTSKKIGVGIMFCVGTFVTIVSMVRLGSLVTFRSSENLTWDYYGVCMWSTVEITVGVICACMPTIRSMFLIFAPKLSERLFGSSGPSQDATGARAQPRFGPRSGRFARNNDQWDVGDSLATTVSVKPETALGDKEETQAITMDEIRPTHTPSGESHNSSLEDDQDFSTTPPSRNPNSITYQQG